MPLCPQITNTPVTVVQNSDFTVSSVLPVVAATTTQVDAAQSDATAAAAAAAAAQASATAANATAAAASASATAAAASAATAQSTANTALANAATAFTTAQNSLQPSAYAIQNPTTKQLTSIDATGLTVFVNSETSGPRVVMNSLGLAGYNSSGPTFSISASTGAAVFSGSVTGSTITGGTLNIGGKAIIDATGLLTATGATITGTINAQSGFFGIGAVGWSITSTGLVSTTGGTIVGGIISGTQFTNGSTFSVSPTGYLLASDVNLTGTIQATAGYIGSATNGWIFTSSGFLRNNNSTTILYPTTAPGGDANTYSIFTDRGVYAERIYSTGTQASSIFSLGGLSVDGQVRGAAGAFIVNSSGNMTTVGSIIASGDITSSTAISTATGTISTGTFTSSSTSQTPGVYMSSTGPVIARRDNAIPFFAHKYNATGTTEMIRLIYNGSDAGGITTTSGGVPAFRNASDYRLKQNIQSFDSAASIVKQINLRSFEFIKDPEEPQIGFIAHELAEVLPALVMGEKDAIDEEGNPAYQSILATNLIPYLTGALKEAILRIEALEGE